MYLNTGWIELFMDALAHNAPNGDKVYIVPDVLRWPNYEGLGSLEAIKDESPKDRKKRFKKVAKGLADNVPGNIHDSGYQSAALVVYDALRDHFYLLQFSRANSTVTFFDSEMEPNNRLDGFFEKIMNYDEMAQICKYLLHVISRDVQKVAMILRPDEKGQFKEGKLQIHFCYGSAVEYSPLGSSCGENTCLKLYALLNPGLDMYDPKQFPVEYGRALVISTGIHFLQNLPADHSVVSLTEDDAMFDIRHKVAMQVMKLDFGETKEEIFETARLGYHGFTKDLCDHCCIPLCSAENPQDFLIRGCCGLRVHAGCFQKQLNGIFRIPACTSATCSSSSTLPFCNSFMFIGQYCECREVFEGDDVAELRKFIEDEKRFMTAESRELSRDIFKPWEYLKNKSLKLPEFLQSAGEKRQSGLIVSPKPNKRPKVQRFLPPEVSQTNPSASKKRRKNSGSGKTGSKKKKKKPSPSPKNQLQHADNQSKSVSCNPSLPGSDSIENPSIPSFQLLSQGSKGYAASYPFSSNLTHSKSTTVIAQDFKPRNCDVAYTPGHAPDCFVDFQFGTRIFRFEPGLDGGDLTSERLKDVLDKVFMKLLGYDNFLCPKCNNCFSNQGALSQHLAINLAFGQCRDDIPVTVQSFSAPSVFLSRLLL